MRLPLLSHAPSSLSCRCRKNENWESKLSFQAEEFLKEREHRDSEVKSWEKEKKRWKAFKTELETEVCVSA